MLFFINQLYIHIQSDDKLNFNNKSSFKNNSDIAKGATGPSNCQLSNYYRRRTGQFEANYDTPCFKKHIYLNRLNGQDPLKRKFLHRCSPLHIPRQSLVRHSLSLVLATTLGCPLGQHKANFSRLQIISVTFVESPKQILNTKSSVWTAPWLAQINFNISDSIIFSNALPVFPSISKE